MNVGRCSEGKLPSRIKTPRRRPFTASPHAISAAEVAKKKIIAGEIEVPCIPEEKLDAAAELGLSQDYCRTVQDRPGAS